MAMARRSQISTESTDDMNGNPIMVALPKQFARVMTDLLEPATVKFMVYSHFGAGGAAPKTKYFICPCLGVAE
ncbi:unnamed protein product [Haemonchus placei]|uniref:Uncharacterized protein n=1 Tax=Haemonchus placei TaxID=6290 RepID=A0A0N4W627_HAEPC|nr:unnamed protein product [Haemonchus placei]